MLANRRRTLDTLDGMAHSGPWMLFSGYLHQLKEAGDDLSCRLRSRSLAFAALCIARCGSVAIVEDGRFTRSITTPRIRPARRFAPRAAPRRNCLHHERLTRPLRRTRPKGEADPGWEQISWDEALDSTAAAMRGWRAVTGRSWRSACLPLPPPRSPIRRLPASADERVRHAEWSGLGLCGWGRAIATRYAFGVGSVATGSGGGAMADIDNSGCLILWGYNPTYSRLTHATASRGAQARDEAHCHRPAPCRTRQQGRSLAAGSPWHRRSARARPCACHDQRGWYDREFVRSWTNAPHLVRSDTGRLLRAAIFAEGGRPAHFVAGIGSAARPVAYDPATGRYGGAGEACARRRGPCRDAAGCAALPSGVRALRRALPPLHAGGGRRSAGLRPTGGGSSAADLALAAGFLLRWSGHEHHANTTEMARAMSLLYALTGSFDSAAAMCCSPPSRRADHRRGPAGGADGAGGGAWERPLGPARWNNVSTHDFYRAMLDSKPYPVAARRLRLEPAARLFRRRARAPALAALEFYVHADLFMNPTAELADIVLPVASCFEREALNFGFDISAEAQSQMQFRQPSFRRPAKRARIPTSSSILPAGSGLLRISGTATSTPPTVTSSPHRGEPGAAARRAGRHAVPLHTRYAKHAEPDARAIRAASPRPRARSSSAPRLSWIRAMRRCPILRSPSARWRRPIWRPVSRCS